MMTAKLQQKYRDQLMWLEMGIPFAESETNPNPMVFVLAMEWGHVIPLLERIKELEDAIRTHRAVMFNARHVCADFDVALWEMIEALEQKE